MIDPDNIFLVIFRYAVCGAGVLTLCNTFLEIFAIW
jgi:hypothetical protein